MVAPLVGAWIEIAPQLHRGIRCLVAPLVGAWIEMSSAHASSSKNLSLPLWERGLKFFFKATSRTSSAVAPLVGAWIEIPLVT